jgi:DNA-binding PadR family transcriptional regulator
MSSQEEKTAAQWLRETQKGYIRIAVLILLSKKPCHGYEIRREIRARTGGFWRPTAGGIYPILQDLEESGYIEGEWDFQKKRKRKTYRVTETGGLVLDTALSKESQIANSISARFIVGMVNRLCSRLLLELHSLRTPRPTLSCSN